MSTPPPIIRYCPSCHKALPNGAAFCPGCGGSSSTQKNDKTPLIIAGAVLALFGAGAIFYALNQSSTAMRSTTTAQATNPGASGVLSAPVETPPPTPEPTPTPIPWPEDSTPILRTTLDEFGKRYDENKIFVKTTYGGKFIALQGQVESISGDLESGRLEIKGLSTNAAVSCNFNSRTTKQLARLRTGAVVIVRGYFGGGKGQFLGSDRLEMADCKVEE